MKILPLCTTALVLLLGTGAALADDRNGFDDRRGYERDNRGNDFRRNDNTYRNDDARWNGNARRNDSRNDNRNWNRNRNDRDRDRVSVNLNFGNVAGSRFRPYYRDYGYSSFGFGIGYNTLGLGTFNTFSYPYGSWGYSNFGYDAYHYNQRRPVVVYQNTYIERPATRTTVITRTAPRSGTSLLRDVQGRCFEREIDKFGNETRTELPASRCNF
jgi:hypothetical protein